MTRRRKIVLLVGAAMPLLVIGGVLLYLRFADLSGWRDTAAKLASDAIGRELRINGQFRPEFGLTTRLVAGDVTLANAAWSDEPHMVAIHTLEASIDLLSIITGPITLRDITIDGARVIFETSSDGRFNWNLGSGEPSAPPGGDVELVITGAKLTDIDLSYARPGGPPIEAQIAHLGFADDGTGMLDVEIDGAIRETPFAISGRLGTLIGLINAGAVEHGLEGHLADTQFALHGSIGSLGSLSGIESRLTLEGPDLSLVLDLIGLDPVVDGPFQVTVSATDSAQGTAIEIDGKVEEITTEVSGTLDSLISPEAFEVAVDLYGPDIRTLAKLSGIEDLPSQPFSVTGHITWQGFPITFDELELRVGPNTFDAHGVLGRPPKMLGTDFRFDGEGPDISALAAIGGLKFPRDDYAAKGRLMRAEEGLRTEEIEIRVGRSTIAAHGFIGDPPGYVGTSLDLEASIFRPDRFSELVGRTLPQETLEVTGRFNEGDRAIDLQGVTVRLGDHELQVEGRVATDLGLDGTEVDVRIAGPDFSKVADLAGLEGGPSVGYEIQGGLRTATGSVELLDMAARIGEVSSRASGTVSRRPDLRGTRLDVSGRGPDLARIEWLTGIDTTIAGDFEASGRVAITERGYEIAAASVRVGGITADLDGVLTDALGFEGTELTAKVAGEDLSALEPLLGQVGLPSAPFSIDGGVYIRGGGYELDTVRAEVDGHRATVEGSLAAGPGFIGTDLELAVSAYDLERLGRLMTDLADLPVLPPEPLNLATRLVIDERGYLLDNLAGSLGRAEFTADGRIGRPPKFIGTDLTVDSDGPDASLFKAVTGLEIPVAPFQVNGRLERLENSIRFHRVSTRIGEHRVSVDGSLGELPKLIGTDLEIHASGPNTNLYEALAGLPDLPDLPDQPFTLDGRFSGTPKRFSTRNFKLTFGRSDIQGFFTVNMTDKPAVEARLDARVLDLSHLGERIQAAKDTAQSTPPGADDATKGKGALLFRDEVMDLGWLQAADANVEIRVDHLLLRAVRFRDLAVDIDLGNGRLEIPRMEAAGRGEGRITGSLLLEPRRERYGLETDISLRHVRLDPPDAVTELLERPPIDIDIDLKAVGATPHELASSTNGAVQLVIGKGIFDSSMLDLVTADILLTLVNAFNPFAKEDPTTELQCGVALLSITEGIAKLEPMAFQSDKMTLLGEGKIDLETEKLNLRWVTKPRKGIGVSASVITNPYIKLGGTLSNPSLELKPLEAMTSTGVAVATMGLSLVAKGMYDRVTAEKKVCKKALEGIEARTIALTGDQR